MELFETRPTAYKGQLSRHEQLQLLEAYKQAVRHADPETPTMRGGVPFRVLVTSMGEVGWWAENGRYDYVESTPEGKPWLPLPPIVRQVATRFGLHDPDTCLISCYESGTGKLGLHQDTTERTLAPVVGVSLGETATFVLGGMAKADLKQRFPVRSGDVVVLAGDDRLAWHGVEDVRQGTSPDYLGLDGWRISFTIRRAL